MTSFRVYIDESGDEGFVFNADGGGSSRWLILSAVVVRKEKDLQIVELMRQIRANLRRQPNQPLHFYKMEHSQAVAYARQIGASHALLRTVSVLMFKPQIGEPEKFRSQKHRLYRYACRLLLERVSWFCRDHRIKGTGDGGAEIVFSNRDQMSYDELRDYLRLIRDGSDRSQNTIDWTVVNPDQIRAVQHSQLAGLQVADAVAHSLYDAVEKNRYGDIENRYGQLLVPTFYRHKGQSLAYGTKFWPDDFEKIKSANPHIAWFAEGPIK